MVDKQSSQKAMDKIMSGKVKQVPRWHFVVRNMILWTIGLICILLGALTVSLIIFKLANSALAMRGVLYQSFFQHVIIFMPVLWIGGTLMFVVLFKFFVRHTKRGYKYSLTIILLLSIISSVLLGVVFYFAGMSHMIDDILGYNFRAYHSVERRQAHLFEKPDEGIIIGRILRVDDESFALVTPSGNQWTVLKEQIPEQKKQFIVKGERFIVLGKKANNEMFVACDVRKRDMMGKNRRVQQRHMQMMQQMDCDESKCNRHHNLGTLPQNIDKIVREACEQSNEH